MLKLIFIVNFIMNLIYIFAIEIKLDTEKHQHYFVFLFYLFILIFWVLYLKIKFILFYFKMFKLLFDWHKSVKFFSLWFRYFRWRWSNLTETYDSFFLVTLKEFWILLVLFKNGYKYKYPKIYSCVLVRPSKW